MIRVAIWLLERSLRPEVSASVIGDLIEQQQRGTLWILRETISALWNLHARRTVRRRTRDDLPRRPSHRRATAATRARVHDRVRAHARS